jgi:Sulfotransferase family
VGAQESARWLEGTQRMMAMGDEAGLPEPILHVHHTTLVADPAGTVARLYRHFGLELTPDVTAAVQRYATQRPNGGYGPRNYRFEDHGLDAAAEREKFRGYIQRFDIN